MNREKIDKEFNKKIREELFYITIFIVISIIVLTGAFFYEEHLDNQIRNLINDPTFTGEIVNKEATTRHMGLGISRLNQVTTFRLHIIGEYKEGNEIIHINQTFKVSRYWYNRFEIGDLIYH